MELVSEEACHANTGVAQRIRCQPAKPLSLQDAVQSNFGALGRAAELNWAASKIHP